MFTMFTVSTHNRNVNILSFIRHGFGARKGIARAMIMLYNTLKIQSIQR